MQLSRIAPHKWRLGRQPTGKVRINWNHPLTRGLKLAVMPSQGYADLTTGWTLTRVGAVYTDASSAGVADNQISTLANGCYFPAPASSSATAVRYDLAALTAFTLIRNKSTAGNNANGNFKRGNSTTTGPAWGVGLWKGSSNGLQAIMGSFSDTPAANNFDTTAKFYACTVTGDGSNAVSYVDGVVSKSGAYTPPTYVYDGGSALRAVMLGSPHNVYGAGVDADMALALMWDHALTAAEVGQISRDPWCIFEYAAPQMIGVTVAGVASSVYYRRTLSQFGSRMGSRQFA